jgi:saccharopine dehydrogenase-like NADP-dependent oxidoreductase
MKILALGGSGGMGRFAVESAMHFENIEQILVADINEASALDFAKSMNEKVSGIGLDITNTEKLKETMRSMDVVINTVGPFFKFGPPVLEAAIECNCHYLDINDDWEPTVEMLKYNDDASNKSVTAILGMGASPGLTNMLGAAAIKELDEVETLFTGWTMDGATPEKESSQSGVNAAMVHAVHQMTGSVRIQENGKPKMVKPLKEVEVDFPSFGKFKPHIFGHPEAITFPHHFKTIKNSINLSHGSGFGMLKWIMRLVDWKIISVERAAGIIQNPSSSMKNYLKHKGVETGPDLKNNDPTELPPLYALAIGKKDGEQASCGTTFRSSGLISMGAATGIPLACGLKLLVDGKIEKKGVFAPEGAIDPNDFFIELNSISDLLDIDEENNTNDPEMINIFRSW